MAGSSDGTDAITIISLIYISSDTNYNYQNKVQVYSYIHYCCINELYVISCCLLDVMISFLNIKMSGRGELGFNSLYSCRAWYRN